MLDNLLCYLVSFLKFFHAKGRYILSLCFNVLCLRASFLILCVQQQIHALVMSLNYMEVDIKTAHSLESWNGGVLVMVSGSVQMKDFTMRRKFVQTFFLAPQEKGYFVLNDIFHFISLKTSL